MSRSGDQEQEREDRVKSALEIAMEKAQNMQLDENYQPEPERLSYDDLAGKVAELESVHDEKLRLLAEFDNFRKRTRQEREELLQETIAVRDLVDLADLFDRALQSVPEQEAQSAFVDGVRLIAGRLHSLLESKGMQRIKTVGELFNPQLHEAVRAEPSTELEPNTICAEFQPGYMIGDRVVKPAKVVVTRAGDEN
jgi:molecular chaperone GrpE